MKNLTGAICGLVLSFALAGAAAGQSDTGSERVENGRVIGAWTVICEALAVGETVCVLRQRFYRADTQEFLAELQALETPDGTQAYLTARVPNGVFFPDGFALRPEDQSDQLAFVWQSCTDTLCEAALALSPEMLAQLDSAAKVLAGYRSAPGADAVVFQFSMNGLAEGLQALRQ